MAKKEKDYSEEQRALFATGRFCEKCAKDVFLEEVPGFQMDVWYGACANCADVVLLPGPALYWNGEVDEI